MRLVFIIWYSPNSWIFEAASIVPEISISRSYVIKLQDLVYSEI